MPFPPQHVLVAVALGGDEDPSGAEALVDAACAIADGRALMRLVFVKPPITSMVGFDIGLGSTATYYRSPAATEASERSKAYDQLQHLVRRAEALGRRATAEVLEAHDGVGRTIVETATRYDADLIAVRSHGRRGPGRFFLGSVTERVAHFATTSVFILRTTPSR